MVDGSKLFANLLLKQISIIFYRPLKSSSVPMNALSMNNELSSYRKTGIIYVLQQVSASYRETHLSDSKLEE